MHKRTQRNMTITLSNVAAKLVHGEDRGTSPATPSLIVEYDIEITKTYTISSIIQFYYPFN